MFWFSCLVYGGKLSTGLILVSETSTDSKLTSYPLFSINIVNRSLTLSGNCRPAVSGSFMFNIPAVKDMIPKTVNWR